MDPSWTGQKFLYDISDKAASSNRGYFIRVVVRSTSTLGVTLFMGRVDIPLSGLQSEKDICGWFPLGAKSSNIKAIQSSGDESYGSIKLRVQWVHTNIGYCRHTLSELRRYGVVIISELPL